MQCLQALGFVPQPNLRNYEAHKAIAPAQSMGTIRDRRSAIAYWDSALRHDSTFAPARQNRDRA
jgi:hypothetical protein